MRFAPPQFFLIAVIAGALACIGGCASTSGAREVYQTRYIPISSESTYSSLERTRWSGDAAVFELPATPPALADVHYPRRNCATPGPQFKGQPMGIANGPGLGGAPTGEATLVGAMSSNPEPVAYTDRPHAYPVGVMALREPNANVYPNVTVGQVGDMSDRAPNYGIENRDPTPLVVSGTRPKGDYCLSPDVTPAPPSAGPKN